MAVTVLPRAGPATAVEPYKTEKLVLLAVARMFSLYASWDIYDNLRKYRGTAGISDLLFLATAGRS
jgi:hypothetical protein